MLFSGRRDFEGDRQTAAVEVEMGRAKAISEAHKFAHSAYVAELDLIVRKFEDKIAGVRARLTSTGRVRPGGMVGEIAAIKAEQITVLLQVRLNSLLKGYQLHGVLIDAELTKKIISEVIDHRSRMIAHAVQVYDVDPLTKGFVSSGSYMRMLERRVAMSPASIRTQINSYHTINPLPLKPNL
jgi:hypothetical protein